jgi:hypothetical protein
MWRLADQNDVTVFIGRVPPETVYMGLTTFCLWKPFRFVFASLGASSNQLTLKRDPNTGLFAYVICFANDTITKDTTVATKANHQPSAYGAVMEALVESGLPEEAINVQVLDPQLLSSKWSFFELVLRIFQFRNQTEGQLYLQSHSHDHPFYYVSAGHSRRNHDFLEDESHRRRDNQSRDSNIEWPVPSKPTGFQNPFHPNSFRENEELSLSFFQYGREVLSDLHRIFYTTNENEILIDSSTAHNRSYNYTNHSFGALNVAEGQDCLKHDTECLGGCPDAAYLGLNVVGDEEPFAALHSWPTPDELHVVTIVDHRALNNSVYGSLALLGSSSGVLDPKHLTRSVKATSVGVTSLELFGGNVANDSGGKGANASSLFATWIFTRNPDHCRILSIASSSSSSPDHLRHGCTVIDSSHLSSFNKYVTYLERIYLNPLTGTRPDYDSILPARLYRVFLGNANDEESTQPQDNNATNNLPFSQIRLPPSQRVATFDGNEPLRFLHIIKTGGESLERYVWKEPSLRIDYGACFAAAAKATNFSLLATSSAEAAAVRGTACNALATITSSALCGLNCECCASDLLASPEPNESDTYTRRNRAFHGTLLRSPRAHVLSQFSHCHSAHHSSWKRIFGDIPLYAAEGILRLTEQACSSSCDVEGENDWFRALQTRLEIDERSFFPRHLNLDGTGTNQSDRVLVISIHNTQSHALTCGKARGSFGHHFKRMVVEGSSNHSAIDEYTPSLEDALSTLDRFEWFGITELFMPSLCLLHYQATQRLPAQCDCDSSDFVEHDQPGALGYWKETRSTKRSEDDLTPNMLRNIDSHTAVDAALYGKAVRIFLGKLRTVEEATGTSLLKCIQWGKFRAKTSYLTELWNDGPNGLLV